MAKRRGRDGRADGPRGDAPSEAPGDEAAAALSSRRAFLAALGGAAALVACGGASDPKRPAATGAGAGGAGGAAGAGGAGGAAGAGGGQAVCEATAPNIEGPFYVAGAPEKAELRPEGAKGVPLSLSGRVRGVDCAPAPGAVLDVWHADDEGGYDDAGYDYRGTVTADAEGRFAIETIVPGHYLNGETYRPAHVHVKVRAPGFEELTTQLYFEGDPYNDGDPFIRDSLIMDVEDAPGGGKKAAFEFTLRRA